MKYASWFLIIILLTVPAFAAAVEEEDGAGFDDASAEGTDDFALTGPKIDPLLDIRNWLGRAGAPALEKSQQDPLKKLYDREVKSLARHFEERFGVSLQSALAAQSRPSEHRGFSAKPNPELTLEIQRISNHLSDALISTLRMDQQVPLRKYQSEMVRAKRVEQTKQKLSEAGVSVSAQQQTQIEAIYARESYLRTLAVIEAGSENYDMTLGGLSSQTTQKVAEVLDRSARNVFSAGSSTSEAAKQKP